MAIPSRAWFPASLQERAAWYDNFATQMQVIGASLGFTVPELDSIKADGNVMQFLATSAVTVEAYNDAIRGYRKTITEGEIGDPTPDFPADITLTLPGVIATGLFERLDNYVKRIRVAPAYTPEIGGLLQIIPSTPEPPPLADSQPKIDAETEPGNIVLVKFVRGKSDGVRIEIAVDKGDWTSEGNFFKSPASLTIPPNPTDLPRSVMIRARFLEGNNAVGDWSDIVTVQTVP